IKNNSLVETKACTRYNCIKPLADFTVGKVTHSCCKTCHNNMSQAKKQKRQEIDDCIIEKENMFDFADITDYVYNVLLDSKDLDNDFEGQTRF
ncbi:13912_t:CDS:1, partial [Cetraspora pellucida]